MGLNLRSSPLAWIRKSNAIDFGGARIQNSSLNQIPGQTYFVSRNVLASGDGKSWTTAFKTLGEAIKAVNDAYTDGFANASVPNRGRNTLILIDEGWYGEIPLVLTANDCTIESAAPGHHDSTVLYGSATGGGFDITSGGPALSIRGNNCSIIGLGMFTHDVLYPSLRIGGNASDADGLGVSTVVGNAVIGCSFIRDVADGSLGGILDYQADGSLIEGCFFSTSCKDYGVRYATNGVINPVNPVAQFNRIVGAPTGFQQDAGHNAFYYNNFFFDDTSDRADTCDTPIVIDATSGQAWNNYAQGVAAANVVTGNGTILEVRNWGSDS